MVDWSLARRVASLAGAVEGPTDVGVDVEASARRLVPEVARYTGLDPRTARRPPSSSIAPAGPTPT
jgi:hypothetical protein